jgi:hypothetical protein
LLISFVLEITPKTRELHLHAAAGLRPDEVEVAEEAIKKSVGNWASKAHADKQVHMEPQYSLHGWVLYSCKDTWLTKRSKADLPEPTRRRIRRTIIF